MRVEHFVRDSARRFPDKAFLVAGDERVSYAEMQDRIDRLARVLRDRGVRRGDRVVVFADPSALTVTAIFAALRAGAVFSPVNPSTKPDKLAYILNNCRAKAVVTQAGLLTAAAEAVAQAPSVAATLADDLPAGAAVRGGVSLREALPAASAGDVSHGGVDIDLAMIIYTSGSTGFPKGVMMTHQNIAHAATSITTYLENTADDVILNALPLSFDYGLYQVLMAAKVGATVVQEKSFAFPVAVLQTLGRERATGFPLVPTMAALLLRMRDLTRVPSPTCGTSPTPPPPSRRRTSAASRNCSRPPASSRCTA